MFLCWVRLLSWIEDSAELPMTWFLAWKLPEGTDTESLPPTQHLFPYPMTEGGEVFSLFRDLRRLSMYFFIFILPLLVRHVWNGATWAGLWTQTTMFCFCGKMCVDSPLWNHLTQLQNWWVPGLENRSKNHFRLLPISMILTNFPVVARRGNPFSPEGIMK